jgi:hypothetical protein
MAIFSVHKNPEACKPNKVNFLSFFIGLSFHINLYFLREFACSCLRSRKIALRYVKNVRKQTAEQRASERDVKCVEIFCLLFSFDSRLTHSSIEIRENTYGIQRESRSKRRKKEWKKYVMALNQSYLFHFNAHFSHTVKSSWIWKSLMLFSVSLFQFYFNDSRDRSEKREIQFRNNLLIWNRTIIWVKILLKES